VVVADSPKRVAVLAACRADLAGGTLDIWPLGLLHPNSCTVNVALDLGVEIRVEPRERGYRVVQGRTVTEVANIDDLACNPDTALIGLVADFFEMAPFDLGIRSASPRGGGLGASSALVIALIAAAEQLTMREPGSAAVRSALARDFEAQLMKLPTGRQDHFPALLGGVLKIEHRAGGELVTRIDTALESLGDSLVVAYTGQSHFSAGNNWEVVRRRLDGDADTVERFNAIASTARGLARALEDSDLEQVGSLMSEEWSLRRGLAPGISTDQIETLLDSCLRAGAWGGKACGAGGGGCVAILAPPRRRIEIERELGRHGAEVLAARPTAQRLRVTVL